MGISHVARSSSAGVAFLLMVSAAVFAPALAGTADRNAVAPGAKISSSTGACLSFKGLRDAVIKDVTLGPCAGNGIELYDSHNVTISNVAITDAGASGVYIVGSTSVTVEESRITGGLSGVYAVEFERSDGELQHDPKSARPRSARPIRAIRQGHRGAQCHQLQCWAEPAWAGAAGRRDQPLQIARNGQFAHHGIQQPDHRGRSEQVGRRHHARR